MAKDTFYNLSQEKRDRILDVLKKTFQEKTIFEANVKEIVEELQIARGSFYQYFENLEDAYFMVLDLETGDIHKLLLETLKKRDYDLFAALEEYGLLLSRILFKEEAYGIYKNKYLYWTPDLERGWQAYRRARHPSLEGEEVLHSEEMEFTKAVIHSLIQRTFLEGWTEEEFLSHYRKYVSWLKEGVTFYGLG